LEQQENIRRKRATVSCVEMRVFMVKSKTKTKPQKKTQRITIKTESIAKKTAKSVKKPETTPSRAEPRKNKKRPQGQEKGLYTLEVFLISGPMTRKFLKKKPIISRTIQIRGDQRLSEFHEAIFDAFDREDEHMYEFQIGGSGPQDPKAKRYVLPMDMEDDFDGPKPAGDVEKTTIGSLGLKVDEAFGYWFDFGDDWWHQINVISIEVEIPKGEYPRVTKRVGASPPQYSVED
jgi:hypothetical protein